MGDSDRKFRGLTAKAELAIWMEGLGSRRGSVPTVLRDSRTAVDNTPRAAGIVKHRFGV